MLKRHRWVLGRGAMVVSCLAAMTDGPVAGGAGQQAKERRAYSEVARFLDTDCARMIIGINGRVLSFIDNRTGTDYARPEGGAPLAHVRVGKETHPCTVAARKGDCLLLRFGKTGVTATMKPIVHKRYLVMEVVSVDGGEVESLTFVDIPLTLEAKPGEPFVACAMALDLKTNVAQIPQPSKRLTATCYRRFGLVGAQVALVACPAEVLRDVMKEVVTAAPALPRSSVGGPWALDAEINRGSYLFNFANMSEQTVDDWIALAKSLGINQIDFHGGGSFRFGDCRPNPKTYPKGYDSLKAVIDRLHAAGIKAGLHTYAFFIHKSCPWVTPVPDPRLGTDATFTLAKPMTETDKTVLVTESTGSMSTTTGFFVRNSVTLRIDEELITYGGIAKTPPYAFTQCTRGACGTKAAAHASGAKVHHLKECFGLFTPGGDSTLLTEVAAKTAEAYNRCGFDMMYMDALDGEDILGGGENGWHYGSKFVFEVCKRLEKPAVMEMSTFHHHLWYVRARMGAWDHPTRSHKKFIDIHCQGNETLKRMFLPGHLGWWAVKTWTGAQGEPTFADDMEYLCCKCIGTGAGFSIMGVGPSSIKSVPVFQRYAEIMRQYEDLRHKDYFDEAVKAELRKPGKEFTLFKDTDGRWRFRRVQYARHKVEALEPWSNVWTSTNPFASQPVRLRIEALMSARPYDAPGNVVLADFADAKDFPQRGAAKGVTLKIDPASEPVKAGSVSGRLVASSGGKTARRGTWAKAVKTFEPARDLSKHQGLGVWVHGDGGGEVLNLQLTSPHHISHGIGDHYVVVDFKGWRYVELIEPEGERHDLYGWPYGGAYAIYRESVRYPHVHTLGLWVNHLPLEGEATCYLSPIKAIPLVAAELKDPTIAIGGKTIVFPVTLPSGTYLEYNGPGDCKVYGPNGQLVGTVKPRGDAPVLQQGANEVRFTCQGPANARPRARVTVISQGEPI